MSVGGATVGRALLSQYHMPTTYGCHLRTLIRPITSPVGSVSPSAGVVVPAVPIFEYPYSESRGVESSMLSPIVIL